MGRTWQSVPRAGLCHQGSGGFWKGSQHIQAVLCPSKSSWGQYNILCEIFVSYISLCLHNMDMLLWGRGSNKMGGPAICIRKTYTELRGRRWVSYPPQSATATSIVQYLWNPKQWQHTWWFSCVDDNVHLYKFIIELWQILLVWNPLTLSKHCLVFILVQNGAIWCLQRVMITTDVIMTLLGCVAISCG